MVNQGSVREPEHVKDLILEGNDNDDYDDDDDDDGFLRAKCLVMGQK